jgi:DNA/RNA endonuclease YhcR with UshA esterase domain
MSLITKLTLSISLLGIILLLILTNTLPAKKLEIQEINLNHLNKKLTTEGKITRVNNFQDFQILTITKDSYSIDILLDQKTNLTNENIIVTGRLEKYQNQFQIRAEIIILSTFHSLVQPSHPELL